MLVVKSAFFAIFSRFASLVFHNIAQDSAAWDNVRHLVELKPPNWARNDLFYSNVINMKHNKLSLRKALMICISRKSNTANPFVIYNFMINFQ